MGDARPLPAIRKCNSEAYMSLIFKNIYKKGVKMDKQELIRQLEQIMENVESDFKKQKSLLQEMQDKVFVLRIETNDLIKELKQ